MRFCLYHINYNNNNNDNGNDDNNNVDATFFSASTTIYFFFDYLTNHQSIVSWQRLDKV